MYDPKGNARDKSVDAVLFQEALPPEHLRPFVHRYLELQTEQPLTADYRFHALPDACTYAIFDQRDRRITGITNLRVTSEELNLGRAFHFINIRFMPGVWQGGASPQGYGQIDAPYEGPLPMLETNAALDGASLETAVPTLTRFVEDLRDAGYIEPNPITAQIFQHLDDIVSVADMAAITGLSARQLQRRLKASTGFAPHDFLKVLRLQQTLSGRDIWSYADQAHFIHSFRNATGYTPGRYAKKFDV